MCISSILMNSLNKENRERCIKIAQYFYSKNRCTIGAFMYVITKPFYN
jgi:UDP-N-acetylglucosamine pyrophosphorylase